MAEYKVLPNNLESEQAVLGCVLIDQDAQVDLLTTLDADDFYSEAHRKIFKAMQNIFAKNIPVDFVTLTSELEVEKELEKVGRRGGCVGSVALNGFQPCRVRRG